MRKDSEMDYSELIESREQGDCMNVPMREAAKQLQAENKRLKDFIKLEIDHAKKFVGISDESEKINRQGFIARARQALNPDEVAR